MTSLLARLVIVILVLASCAAPEVTAATTQPTFESRGLVCLRDLYEFEIGDFPEDYVGFDTPEEAVEQFIDAVPLMRPHPRDLDLAILDWRSATFESDDGRPVLILQIVDLGNGYVVEGHRRCAPQD